MPSSRRRVVWVVCAVDGAVFKDGQSTLTASKNARCYSPACQVRTATGGSRQKGTEAEMMASPCRGSLSTMMFSLVECQWNATSLRIAACATRRGRRKGRRCGGILGSTYEGRQRRQRPGPLPSRSTLPRHPRPYGRRCRAEGSRICTLLLCRFGQEWVESSGSQCVEAEGRRSGHARDGASR